MIIGLGTRYVLPGLSYAGCVRVWKFMTCVLDIIIIIMLASLCVVNCSSEVFRI